MSTAYETLVRLILPEDLLGSGEKTGGGSSLSIKDKLTAKGSFENKRSVIQLAELHYNNGVISCDRDEPATIHLVNK